MNPSPLLSLPIPLLIRRLAIPSSLGLLFNTLYNIVDTYYAGLISTQALSALSSSSFLFFVMIGLGYGGSSGITALVGHALGESNDERARVFASKGIGLMLLLGCVIGLLGFFGASWSLSLVGIEPIYHPLALAFIETILLGTPFFFANFGLNAILVAKGDTKSFRNTLIFGFFANIILNPLLIYGWGFIPALEIAGIALATVIVQVLSAAYLTLKVFKTDLLSVPLFLPDRLNTHKMIEQSLPSALNMLMISFGSLIALYFVTHYGYKAVAGYGIGYRVEQLFLLPCLGISSATLSLVSNNMGAHKLSRVRETLYAALKYGYGVALVGLCLLYLSSHFLIASFDDDAQVIAYGEGYISVMMLLSFGYVTHFVCVATLQGMKHPQMIFYIGAFRQLFAPSLVYFCIVSVFRLDIVWMWIGLGGIVYSSALVILWYTLRLLSHEELRQAQSLELS